MRVNRRGLVVRRRGIVCRAWTNAAGGVSREGRPSRAEPDPPKPSSPADPVAASKDQVGQIKALLRSLQACEPDVDWKAEAQKITGVPARMLTGAGAVVLIRRLEERLAELVDEAP